MESKVSGMFSLWCFLLLAYTGTRLVRPAEIVNRSGVQEKSIFVLAGQSNMAGRGGVLNEKWDGIVPAECQSSYSILRLNPKLEWEEAREPLHVDIDRNRTCGVGPGMPFANAVREMDSSIGVVGLVPCAVGGTTIGEWSKGTHLYRKLVKRSKASVKEGGRIRAVLWYQGEADTISQGDAERYGENLKKLIADLRADLHFPMLPFIQVGLASAQGPFKEIVRNAQLDLNVPNVWRVDAEGLSLESDGLHLTTNAQVKLGQMLAEAFIKTDYQQLQITNNAQKRYRLWIPPLAIALNADKPRAITGPSYRAKQERRAELAELGSELAMKNKLMVSGMFSLWCFLLLAYTGTRLVQPAESVNRTGVQEKNIFVLAGQSNMAGRGGVLHEKWDGVVPAECQSNSSILRLNSKLEWEEAKEPLHVDIDRNKTCGVGPGMSFAHAVRNMNSSIDVVGLVPCAVGGTSIGKWSKGTNLYKMLVKRSIASVKEGGRIRAVLWYQGESDTNRQEDAKRYGENLKKLIADLRADLHFPKLPFIQVGLASAEGPFKETVRNAQLNLNVPNVWHVDAEGLPLGYDGLHLTTNAQVKLGQMLAEAFIKIKE